MKTTVLNASKAIAEQVSIDLLKYKSSNGTPLFKREDLENGFQITGKQKIAGTWEDVIVFRYTKTAPGEKFEYNEKLLSF